MNAIHVLDKLTIDKIAAGEVVERPASVVKELVENAIDAGASRITVEIKGGGTDLIRVTDNGCGMVREDIKTAFLRHATSKIISIDDLQSVRSLGFRGEALSSICAVARVELLTKTGQDICGTRYVTEGGREMAFEDAGVPDGTTIIVRDLFFNTPARRKFLKTAATEGSYCAELMEKIMLSHADLSIKFIMNGNVKLQTTGDGSVPNIIHALYGKDVASLMIPVEGEYPGVTIGGYVGKPELSRNNRNYELFFVNGRCIKSTVLSRAVDEAYKNYLMLHRFPYTVLYLTVPPHLLDVNVHPAKLEVRFQEADRIYEALTATIREAVSARELIPDALSEAPRVQPEAPSYIAPEPFETVHVTPQLAEEAPYRAETAPWASYEPVSRSVPAKDPLTEGREQVLPKESEPEQLSFLSPEARVSHRLIGQLFDTYLLVEFEDKLFLIDQHAAHEKIRYERFRKGLGTPSCSQMLDPPHILSLTLPEEETLKAGMEVFSRAGFEIEHFGGNEYAIRAVPADLYGIGEVGYFRELLDVLAEGNHRYELDSVLAHLASVSCKGAVKAGKKLHANEAEALIDELLTLENPYHCPHGRPVIVSYSKSDLEKQFKRIV